MASSRTAPSVAVASPARRARLHLNLRLDTHAKRTIERAAAYVNKSTTAFVLEQALVVAERVIDDQQRQRMLSNADWSIFFTALVTPPKPNSALRAALRRHQKRTAG